MNFSAHAVTDVGQRRPHNEDHVLCRPDLGLYVVCDGMGGHAAGEVASAMAIETVEREIESQIVLVREQIGGTRKDRRKALQAVERAVKQANYAIHAAAEVDAAQRGMGTTLSLLLMCGDRAIIAQVGDSRLYLTRGGQTHQVTTDHTILTEMVRAGRVDPNDEEQTRHLNALTRAVGVHPEVEVDTLELDVLPGDVFLVCSDGLHGYLDDLDLSSFFLHSTQETAATNLVEFANKRGGHDNISVITVHVQAGADTEQSIRVRLTLDTLKTIPLFHYLSFSELLKVIPVCQPRFASPGDLLIEDNSAGTDFFIVLEGSVRVHKGDTTITVLGAGRYFGEMSLVDNRPRSASVSAVEQSQLIRVTRDDFYQVLREDPVLAVKLLWNFIQTLSSFVRLQNQSLPGAKMPFPTSPVHPYEAAQSGAEEEGDLAGEGDDV